MSLSLKSIQKPIIACLCFLPMLAGAHGLHLHASSDGHTIAGVAYYSNGEAAGHVEVKLLNLSTGRAQPASTHTDATGRFGFKVESSQLYRIVVHEDEGHSVATEIRAEANALSNAHHHHDTAHHHQATVQRESRIPWVWAIFAGMLAISLLAASRLAQLRDSLRTRGSASEPVHLQAAKS